MGKRKVHLVQVNHKYGTNVFVPYSVGMLWAYAMADKEIHANYELNGFTYLRDSVPDAVAALPHDLDVLGVSSYIWNSTYTHEFARQVKERFPECLVVMGGPHVPNRSDGYFQKHPYLDLLVHYEGEVTFSAVLKERTESKPDYSKLEGLSVNSARTTVKTPNRDRIDDLDKLPSPYLTGLFDRMLSNTDYSWNASSETHRGCPYSCAFCDWGSNTMAKLKQFNTERMLEDYEYMAKYRVEMLYNCDANYGIFARDVDLTERMIKIKEKYGYPKKFRAAYAKNSNDRVFQVSKMLNDAGMSKGTTLSFQSMDEHTLEVIRRKNIKVNDFKNLMDRYRGAGIPTYSEMICGLPGETYDTWADGFDKLLSAAPDASISCYSCEVLPNAEMGDPKYRELHGIKSVKTPVLFFHASEAGDSHTEQYEIVTSTNSLPPTDWLKSQMLAWVVQGLHRLGLTQKLAVYAKYRHQITYRRFYEDIIAFAESNPNSVIATAYDAALQSYSRLRRGLAWGFQDPRFGDIIWPVEEGGFLLCAVEADRFYEELKPWLKQLMPDDPYLADVLSVQMSTVKLPRLTNGVVLASDMVPYLDSCYKDQPTELVVSETFYKINGEGYGDDLERWSREIVWFGRKGGSFFWPTEKRT